MATLKSIFNGIKTTGLIYLSAVVMLVLYLLHLLQYIFSGRDRLIQQYFPSDACFYKSSEFTTRYFNEHVKIQGNQLAGIGVGLCIALIGYCLHRYKQVKVAVGVRDGKREPINRMSYLPLVLLGIPAYFWYRGQVQLGPSGDEIFSAVYCAETSLFKTWAYYMMPNNHIFFNLLNNLVAKATFSDAVYTGRAISFVAYLSMLVVAFGWLNKLVKNRAVSAIACLPLMFQFTTFILAQQNRGYELQLLFGWMSYVSLLSYLIDKGRRELRLFTVSSVLGFACIPTYSYFFGAQLLFCLCVMVYERKADLALVLHAVLIGFGVFLFYLPSLCFSGLDALINNEYVKAGTGNYVEFIQGFYTALKTNGNTLFSNLIERDHWVNMVLFLMPLLLLFAKKRERRLVGIFYILLWIVWGIFCFKMQRLPYYRNMVLHYSITVATIVYTFYLLVAKLFSFVKPGVVRYSLIRLAFVVPVLIVSYQQYMWCYRQDNYAEEQQINAHINAEIGSWDKGAVVGCSPYSFCYFYFSCKAGHVTHYCLTGNEDLYINLAQEPLPANIMADYSFLKKLPDGYEMYKRK